MNARKAALVTGGAKRLGEAIALKLASLGYDIALHYHQSYPEITKVRDRIHQLGVDVDIFSADLSRFCYEQLMKEVVKRFPHLEILINNASIFERKALMETTESDYMRHMDINLKAPMFLMQAFAKQAKRGCIVNMVDSYVVHNKTPFFPYLLSKKALLECTKMAATVLAPDIRVHAICPGVVLPSSQITDQYFNDAAGLVPMQRRPTVTDITDSVVMVIQATHLTGQIVNVDGGGSLI